ncbi:unnamed protein product [Symbiodinium sp. CCMP2592]|nr:unnamed protein product [Symbiodinium sp. CCMP2592]
MLDKYEREEDRNQFLLRPWVVACEAALILKDNADKVRAMNPASRLQHINAVEAVGAEVPISIKSAVAASSVEEKFEMLLKANSNVEVLTAVRHILQTLMPFQTIAMRTEAKINQVAEKMKDTTGEMQEAIMDAFGCDAFFKLVMEGSTQWKKILKFSQALLQELASDTAKAARGMGWDSILKRMQVAAQAFCMLLDPEDTERSFQDLAAVRSYKGDLSFEHTLKSSLSSGAFWNNIVDNILQTATATKLAASRISDLRTMAKGPEIATSDLLTIVAELPQLRKTVRRGSLESIEHNVQKCLKDLAIKIVNQQSPQSGDGERITVVMQGLPLFDSKEGVLDLLARVRKWQAGHTDFMVASEIEDILRNIETKTLGDLASFVTKILSKERQDTTAEMGKQLVGLLPQMLACAKQEVLDEKIPQATFKSRWQCMKLLVREIQKSLPPKHFDYLINLLDLTFFGCMLVNDLRALKQPAAEDAAEHGVQTDILERCAKSVKGIGSLKSKCAIMENPADDAEPAAEQAVDGENDVLASLLTSGLSTNFDSLCEDKGLRDRISKLAEEFATTTVGNHFTVINNVAKKWHSDKLWKNDLENPDDFGEVTKLLEKTLQGLSGNGLRKALDDGKKIHNNANGIVKSYSFFKLAEVDTLQQASAKLAQELRLLANVLTEQILFTCVTNPKLKGSAAEIIRQQMTEIQARNAESEILPILIEKAKAFLNE